MNLWRSSEVVELRDCAVRGGDATRCRRSILMGTEFFRIGHIGRNGASPYSISIALTLFRTRM